MKRLNVHQFYKRLNKEYSVIKSYNKDVIYDYNLLFKLEQSIKTVNRVWPYDNIYSESSFTIAIFIRDTGTHTMLFNSTFDQSLFDTCKKLNNTLLICHKCLDKYDMPFYFITKFKLN